jgi:hypothetical protein
MAKEKQSWIFYQSWEESVNLLSLEERGQLLTNLINYHNGEEIVLDTPMLKMFWSSIQFNLDRNAKRYKAQCENGGKGGRPKTQLKPNNNPIETQSKPNHNLNDNDNDNDNDNVNDNRNDDDNHHDYNIVTSIASSSTEEPSPRSDGSNSEQLWEEKVFSGLLNK